MEENKNINLEQITSDVNYESPWTTMSIIIPTFNSGYLLPETLESILGQKYSDFEIIIIDANSQDNTLEVINRFCNGTERVYSVTEYKLYDMLNYGISLAHGFYVTFLFPGDFYLSMHALMHMAHIITDANLPDIAYCGSLYDEGHDQPSILLEQMLNKKLRRGEKPCILQACWFKKESLNEIGDFNSEYFEEGGFELLCRFYKNSKYNFIATNRVLVDDSRRIVKYAPGRFISEMWCIINRYFGFFYAFLWLIRQRPDRIIRNILRKIRFSFLGH